MLCSAKKPSLETTKDAVVLNPTASVSKISSTGKFGIHFSDAMNLESFINTKARRLRGKSGGSTKSTLKLTDSESNSSSSSSVEPDYLLSAKHLRIQMIHGPEFNSTLFKFKWEVLSLTETDIEIQILFDFPLSISNEAE
jgi:hypothetical protein